MERGNHEELLHAGGLYSELHDIQFQQGHESPQRQPHRARPQPSHDQQSVTTCRSSAIRCFQRRGEAFQFCCRVPAGAKRVSDLTVRKLAQQFARSSGRPARGICHVRSSRNPISR